ncbi:hypothetical protein B0H14DRAFT_2599213 [Mycena olivaceomarginata]|nr:hypothetical protein B0H14DRAFT_2599213 [Mycena olivaceomarginata]
MHSDGFSGPVITTKDESVSEFRCCMEVKAISIPSNYFYEYLDVPAAEYLNSLHIQGRLFSNSRGKGLVIVTANNVPDQILSRVWSGSAQLLDPPAGIIRLPLLFTPVGKGPISLVMKYSQNFFNGTGAKATDQLQLAPIFPVTNCVRATPSRLDFTKFSSSKKPPDQPSHSRNPHYLIR